jgi:hypothetical protein
MLPVVLPGRSVNEIPIFLQPWTADHYLVKHLTVAGAAGLLRHLIGDRAGSATPSAPLFFDAVASGIAGRHRAGPTLALLFVVTILVAFALIADRPVRDACDLGKVGTPVVEGRRLGEMPKASSSALWHNEDARVCGQLLTSSLVAEPVFCPMKPVVYAEFDLGRSYRHFRARVGISDLAPNGASARFIVSVDGERSIAEPRRKGERAFIIDLAIDGKAQLRLEVDQYQYCGRFLVWGLPTLSME